MAVALAQLGLTAGRQADEMLLILNYVLDETLEFYWCSERYSVTIVVPIHFS